MTGVLPFHPWFPKSDSPQLSIIKKKLKYKLYTVICNYVRVIVCKKHFLKISKNMVGTWTNHTQLHVFLQCNEVIALSFVFYRGCKIAYYQQYVNQLNLTADLYNILHTVRLMVAWKLTTASLYCFILSWAILKTSSFLAVKFKEAMLSQGSL